MNLPHDEYSLYETVFDIIYPNIPQSDVLIFLNAPLNRLKANIKERNRSYEQEIELVSLQKIQDAYSTLLKTFPFIVLVIDVSEVDFLNNPRHFRQLLNYLEQDFTQQIHYLDFT